MLKPTQTNEPNPETSPFLRAPVDIPPRDRRRPHVGQSEEREPSSTSLPADSVYLIIELA